MLLLSILGGISHLGSCITKSSFKDC